MKGMKMNNISKLPHKEKLHLAATSSSVDVLEALSQDEGLMIRHYVASNKYTPLGLLEKMIDDSKSDEDYEEVLCTLAENELLTEEILMQLSQLNLNDDLMVHIKENLAKNLSAGKELLHELSKNKISDIKLTAIRNPSISSKRLSVLSNNLCEKVKKSVILNPSVTNKILKKLTNDSCFDIRSLAEMHLRIRDCSMLHIYTKEESTF